MEFVGFGVITAGDNRDFVLASESDISNISMIPPMLLLALQLLSLIYESDLSR